MMDDRQIVELYWQRDGDAIVQSRQKYGGYCFAVAHNILGDLQDSEECVNDTWLGAWNAMPPHRPQALKLFLARITRSLSFNRYKARTAQKRGGGETEAVLEELAECLAAETDTEQTLLAKELGETIRRFVDELPGRECRVFVRRYFYTESIADIAACCGLTENHVSVLLHRTREQLRKRLIREGYFDEPQ